MYGRSFLTIICDVPKDFEHFCKMLRGEDKRDVWYNFEFVSAEDAVDYLGVPEEEDLCLISKENKENVNRFVVEFLLSGEGTENNVVNIGYPVFPRGGYKSDEEKRLYNLKMDEFYKQQAEWARDQAEYLTNSFIKNYSGKYLCEFYADEASGRVGKIVEHGDTFNYLPFKLSIKM